MKKKNLFLTACMAAALSFSTSCATGEYAYEDWNTDADGALNDDEFDTALTDTGYYDNWDNDGDNLLTEDEWGLGVNEYFGDYDSSDYGLFNDWDIDGDGMLSEDEFGEGTFGVVDDNDNDLIEENEYDMWYDSDFGL